MQKAFILKNTCRYPSAIIYSRKNYFHYFPLCPTLYPGTYSIRINPFSILHWLASMLKNDGASCLIDARRTVYVEVFFCQRKNYSLNGLQFGK